MTPILSIKGLHKRFSSKSSLFSKTMVCHALKDVSFDIENAKTCAVIGESGCGKSTLAKIVIGVDAADEGEILFEGNDINKYGTKRPSGLIKEIQLVFQNPYSSLNPRQSAFDIIAEPLKLHTNFDKEKRKELVYSIMDKVGLSKSFAERYPHMFSGGQRQRIAIARAIILNPSLLVLDEPISALDLSIQAQVLNLLLDLKNEFKLSYLFITHNVSIIDHFADYLIVMYLGRIVEQGKTSQVLKNPTHPYTKALLKSTLTVGNRNEFEFDVLKGEIPSPFNPPAGCPFVTRCPIAEAKCHEKFPQQKQIEGEHKAYCIKI